VRQRVAAALHFLASSHQQLGAIALYSFRVFLKSSILLGHLEYSEAKAAPTRRTPRLGQMTFKVRAERLGVRQRVAAAFHFLGKFASTIWCDCLVLVSRVFESFKFTEAFRVLRSESGADTPQSKARPNDVHKSARSAISGQDRFASRTNRSVIY